MIVKGPLKTQQNGVNYISDGHCCPQSGRFYIGLRPNEQPKVITDLIWTDATCGSSITYAGYLGNPQPFPPLAANISLTDPLDPQDLAEVIVDLCGCGTIGDTFTIQLNIDYLLPTGPNTQTVYFDFEVIDHVTAKIITVTDVNFWDCVNDCGKKVDIVPIVNPFSTDLEITFNDPLTGFVFYVDGIQINPVAGVYTITVPGESSVTLQVANPGCAIAIDTDFSLTFNYCTISKTVNVNHRIVQCNGCGIDCEGITVSTVINLQVIPDPDLNDPTNWTPSVAFGSGPVPTVTLSGGKLQIIGGGGGYNEIRLAWDPPVAYINNSPQTFQWSFRTGTWGDINNSNAVYMFSGTTAWPGSVYMAGVPYSLPTLTPNTTYSGTFTVNPFVPPAFGSGNGPVLVIQIFNQLGKTFEILEWNVDSVGSQSGTNFDCSDLDIYNLTAIGDKKQATYTLFYEKGWQSGTELFFNPKVFGDDCDFSNLLVTSPNITITPNTGWKITANSLWIGDGNWHGFQLFGLGAIAQTQSNFYVELQLIDDYQFKIRFTFYLTMDVDDWIRSFALQNPDRLLKNHRSNANILINDVNSVYNDANGKSLCAMIVIRDPNILVPSGNNSIPYVCGTVKSVLFSARFWNQGLFALPSEMTNPTWTFTRSVGTVNSLATLEKTAVSFKIDYFNPVDTVVLWLFNRKAQNSAQNFYSNYDSSRSVIVDNPAVGIISNDLHSPSTAPTNIGGSTYEVTCYIDKNIDPVGDYYIGAICYSSTDEMVNSFLYHFNPVTNGPEVCCDLDITSQWLDYNTFHFSDCHTTAPKEPFMHQLNISGGALQTCMVNDWGMDPSKLWTDYLATCYLKVYQKVQDYPAIGTDAYFAYLGYQQTRNTAYFGNWPNNITNNVWTLSDGGGNLVSFLRYRSRYEANILPINVFSSNQSTPFQYTLIGGQAAAWIAANNITFDWSDKDIYFHYTFVFNLNWLPTNPFLQINYIAKLHPCDFETNPLPYSSLLSPLIVTGYNTSTSSVIGNTICSGKWDYLEVTVNGSVPDGTCMATIDYKPYGINNLKEEENSTPPGNPYFYPVVCVEIYDVQNFSSGTASFKIDMSQLPQGEYQICAIYIPY